MNILYVAHDKNLSGASRSLLEIIENIEDKHNIYVLVPTANGDFYKEIKKHQCRILVFPYYLWVTTKTSRLKWIIKKLRWAIIGKAVNAFTVYRVSKIVRKERIDIIHTNTGVTEIGAAISKRTNVRHIWHIREFGDLDFNMYPLPRIKTYKYYMSNYATIHVFNSQAVMKHYDYIKGRKIVIYNAVGKEYKIETCEKENHEGINLLIAGRISTEKGQNQAIEACRMLLSKQINNFHLYIAGTGKINYIHSDLLDSHITFLGSIKDLKGIRKKIDIELVCSLYEAFGRVTVEAMYAGIPVIGSNSGGTAEIIIDGRNGLLYESNNIADLADKMERLIIDNNMREQLGYIAKKYAIEKFSIERLIAEINILYKEVMQYDRKNSE